jgi:hypothetical protein
MPPPSTPCRQSGLRGERRGFAVARWLLALAALLGTPCQAASLTSEELRILSSALAFTQPRPSGDGVAAIVYSSRDSASRRDAEAIYAAIGQNLTPDGAALAPRLVEVGELASLPFNLVIVAAGANGEAVARATAARKALCVTAEQDAVRQGTCVVSIHSAGKVQIVVNARAAHEAGINFATAFRMMVSEQ